MKNPYRLSVLVLFCAFAQVVGAQTLQDAVRFSREELYGTARSMAMGNAMTAIGGDIGALSVNPAATGVYRYSEFVMSPGGDFYTGTSDYLGTSTRNSKGRFVLGNVGFVGYIPTGRRTGILNLNWSVSGNQTQGYVSRTSVTGRDAASSWLASKADLATYYGINNGSLNYTSGAPWDIVGAYQSWQIDNFEKGLAPDDYSYYLANTENMNVGPDGYLVPNGKLDQQYSRESWGYTYDFDFNFAGNVANKLFFGITLTAQSIYYCDSEYYRESAVNKNDFETGFEYMNYRYNRTTRGVGFKAGVGVIYRPVAGLSIGASITTPVWKKMKDYWTQDIDAYSALYTNKTQSAKSPEGDSYYRMTTPFQWNIGLGYTVGKRAVIAVDYSNYNMSNVIFKPDNVSGSYADLNDAVGTYLHSYHTVRAGLEVRVAKGFALRGGYNLMTSCFDSYAYFKDLLDKNFSGDDLERYCRDGNRQSWSVGAGYRGNSFFFDVAFQQQFDNVFEYQLYNNYQDLSVRSVEVAGKQVLRYARNGDVITAPTLKESFKPWKLLFTIGFKF